MSVVTRISIQKNAFRITPVDQEEWFYSCLAKAPQDLPPGCSALRKQYWSQNWSAQSGNR
jgi:hypothetical protein